MRAWRHNQTMATLVSKKKALAKNRSKPQKVLNRNCCLKTFDKRGADNCQRQTPNNKTIGTECNKLKFRQAN
jgi:hypothetical protein